MNHYYQNYFKSPVFIYAKPIKLVDKTPRRASITTRYITKTKDFMMSLNKKEIKAIIKEPSTFYLYKDKVTHNDMIKLVHDILQVSSVIALDPILKTAKEESLLTDKIKAELFKCIRKDSDYQIGQLAEMLKKYDIYVSNELLNTVLMDTYNDDWYKCAHIIITFKPYLNNRTISHLVTISRGHVMTSAYDYFIDQLVKEQQYKFITSLPELFRYIKNKQPELAHDISNYLIEARELEYITERENNTADIRNILFTDDLIDDAIKCCLDTNQPRFVVNNTTIWKYLGQRISSLDPETNKQNTQKENFKGQTIRKLCDNQDFEFLLQNQNTLSYILAHNPESIKNIPAKYYADAIKCCYRSDLALKLMDALPLPNADLEFEYIKAHPSATTEFPSRKQLSPETIKYLLLTDIQVDSKLDPILFTGISSRTTSALINCEFPNKADWYKLMEHLLIARPNLDKKYIKQMLNRDKKVEPIIKKHWNGNLTGMHIQDFIAAKKQRVVQIFNKQEKTM